MPNISLSIPTINAPILRLCLERLWAYTPMADCEVIIVCDALNEGRKVFLEQATGVVGLHETHAVVGPRWAVPYPDNNPFHGVCGVL